MMVEIRPWNGGLGLNQWLGTLFSIKKSPVLSYGSYRSAFIDVKSGSSDPADFSMTRLPFHWHIAL
jgi:hypothetical protein